MALQRGADALLSNNEKEFITKALRGEQRIDGRGPFDYRPVTFQFSLDDSSCTVHLGQTRVMAVVTASLEAPYPDRHSEGSLRFNVELPPMASPAFEAGRPGEAAVELGRLVERGLRESRAVDLEALCVLAGRRVWALRVDVTVLDHCGNLADGCGLAALGALCAFRRPDATVDPGASGGGGVTVHPAWEREPLPLTIHHLPLPVTFALFDEGERLVVDPSLKEGAASAGSFTVTANPHGELCAVQKAHGAGLSPAQALRCIRVAVAKVKDLTGQLRKALDAHEVARVAARVRRRDGPSAATAGGGGAAFLAEGRSVLVLRSDELPSAELPAAAATLHVPEDIQQLMEHAAAPDSSDEGESEVEESGSEDGKSSAEEDEEGEQEAAEPTGMEVDGGPAAEGGATAAAEQGQRTKAKRRKTAAGDGRDPFADIAELIAAAGGKEAGGAASGLVAAVKHRS